MTWSHNKDLQCSTENPLFRVLMLKVKKISNSLILCTSKILSMLMGLNQMQTFPKKGLEPERKVLVLIYNTS